MENKLAVLKGIYSLNALKSWLVDAGLVKKVLEQIEKDTDRNHWMTPTEALDYHLIDKIIEKNQ